MQWKERIFEISLVYERVKNVRQAAKELGCSVGLVSEAIQLVKNWEKIKDCSTRVEALSILRYTEESNFEHVHFDNVNAITVSSHVASTLRKLDSRIFDIAIADLKYLDDEIIYQVYRTLREDRYVFVFSLATSNCRDGIEKLFKVSRQPLFWINSNPTGGNSRCTIVTEEISVLCKGSPRFARETINVFTYPGVNPALKISERERPIELMKKLISISLKSKGNVLDPLCRSAEVLIAAKQLGHNYYGVCRYERDWSRICKKISRY